MMIVIYLMIKKQQPKSTVYFESLSKLRRVGLNVFLPASEWFRFRDLYVVCFVLNVNYV